MRLLNGTRIDTQHGSLRHCRRCPCAATPSAPATSMHTQAADSAGRATDSSPGSYFAVRQGESQAAAPASDHRHADSHGSTAQQLATERRDDSSAGSSVQEGSGRNRSGWPKQPKKVIPWPTPVRAREPLSADPMTWQNAAVLVDKPLDWSSFDVCAKLRGALHIRKVRSGCTGWKFDV